MEAQLQHGSLTDVIPNAGPYVLRDLLSDIPISADGDSDAKVHITCVDHWDGNLYVGTSSGELLHFVSIPGDAPGDVTWIIASRLQPPFSTTQEAEDEGVKQILLLPEAGKACVLCNATLTFYTLPELSPAFGGKIKQAGCTWVGGLDLNDTEGHGKGNGTVIVICLRQRLRLIRIGDEARKIRDIELGGVRAIARRGNLACVADGASYSLLDVVNEAKIDLFPITSNSEPVLPPEGPRGKLEISSATQHGHSRSVSGVSPARRGRHDRNVSLGAELKSKDSSSPWPARTSSQMMRSPAEPSSRIPSPNKSDVISGAPLETPDQESRHAAPERPPLPHIASPTGAEFLLTTGTRSSEPGVGMFVNLDGDVVRGTIEFTTYPRSLLFDGGDQGLQTEDSFDGLHEGYALAVVQKHMGGASRNAIEIQRWDTAPGEAQRSKSWLQVDQDSTEFQEFGTGIRRAQTSIEISTDDIGKRLRSRKLHLSPEDVVETELETKRNAEEDQFASRFSRVEASILLYSGSRVQWLVRCSLLSQLDAHLSSAITTGERLTIDIDQVRAVINEIRGRDAHSELEFITFTYIRQKASLLLFGALMLTTANDVVAYESNKRVASEALVEGEIDPRVLLSLIPSLSTEVKEASGGIWTPQGLRDTVDMLRQMTHLATQGQDVRGPYGDNLLQVLKRYLLHWRAKKGFGSIADEAEVFQTVDAALLHILLLLDQHSPRGPATPNSVRAELNDVIDKGVDCFPRAVVLLTDFSRLHLLSRLYQSRKLIPQVLETWKMILEGAHDAGGEMIEGEQDMRRYLSKIRDRELVTKYGAWLANRNPRLGVQVFADEQGRVKFSHQDTVALLRAKAPGAVKEYLEYLVFTKHQPQYGSELLAFYLTSVLAALDTSPATAQMLEDGYTAYRALEPPKPTYTQFIADNSAQDEFASSRGRLMQLLSSPSAAEADLPALRAQIAPHAELLVPETIILHARTADHDTALRLLTHNLGDFDTAISYCLRGGTGALFTPSHPTSGSVPLASRETQSRLFVLLLHSFLTLPLPARIDRSAELLERFGAWFELDEVLAAVPGDWSVHLLAPFVVGKLRELVSESREASMVKQLSGAQNLRVSVEAAEKMAEIGAVVMIEEAGGDTDIAGEA